MYIWQRMIKQIDEMITDESGSKKDKTREAKTDITGWRNRQDHNRKQQYSLLINQWKSKQKISKTCKTLSANLSWHLWNTPPNNSRIRIFFKCTLNLTQVDHILGHKTYVNKFERTETILSIFSTHNGIKLVWSITERYLESPKCLEIKQYNSTFQNNHWLKRK